MSFVGGPYFAKLRKRILQKADVLRLDLIDKRSDVFLDVLYDLCVIVLRRTDGPARSAVAKTSLLMIDEPNRNLGSWSFPARPNTHVWALPDDGEGAALFQPGLATLGDYGYLAKTGYFVWNREQHRYRIGRKPRANEVPLFWAHNVRPNRRCLPQDGDAERIGFAKIPRKRRDHSFRCNHPAAHQQPPTAPTPNRCDSCATQRSLVAGASLPKTILSSLSPIRPSASSFPFSRCVVS